MDNEKKTVIYVVTAVNSGTDDMFQNVATSEEEAKGIFEQYVKCSEEEYKEEEEHERTFSEDPCWTVVQGRDSHVDIRLCEYTI